MNRATLIAFILAGALSAGAACSQGNTASALQAVDLLQGLPMGSGFATVQATLDARCRETRVIEKAQPRYPLAAEHEVHLLCEDYTGEQLSFTAGAFVIADDQLVQVEALGVYRNTVHALIGEADGTYLGMENYRQGTVWHDVNTARLIWLSNQAVHPNLFAWPNPNLAGRTPAEPVTSTRFPDLLDFTADLETLKPLFESQCSQTVLHENERIWLPSQPESQVQIDCFGFPYAGFDRKLEAVFGDGRLQVVWVLTGKPEEDRLRRQLTSDWGEAEHIDKVWEVFAEGRISLRKDKPELLLLAADMVPLYSEQLGID